MAAILLLRSPESLLPTRLGRSGWLWAVSDLGSQAAPAFGIGIISPTESGLIAQNSAASSASTNPL
jgi:hypothetical protein